MLYKHIKEFYDASGTGAELWVYGIADSVSMPDFADKTKAHAPALLNGAKGNIRLLAISQIHKAGETATNGVAKTANDTVAKAQELATERAGQNQPLQIILDGKGYTGTVADLKNYKSAGNTNVNVSMLVAGTGGKNASVGLLLGTLAKVPVQRNVARVKNGALPIATAKLTDEKDVETLSDAVLGAIHDKGYIALRTYRGRSGFYFTDDPTLSSNTIDRKSIGLSRVISKAMVIAFVTYTAEIGDEVAVDSATGYLAPVVVKNLEGSVLSALKTQMKDTEEIVDVGVTVDEKQDIQTSGKVEIQLRLVPFGYFKQIIVNLGFAKKI